MSAQDKKGGVWTLAELRDGKLHGVSLELLAWGRDLADKKGAPLASVVLGSGVSDGDVENLIRHGADRVYVVDSPELADFRVDAYTKVLRELVAEHAPDIFIASATTQGRTVMPTLYAATGTGLTADCTGLDIDEKTGLLLQTRPAIGGNVMATIKTPERRPQMCTVRPRSKKPLPRDDSRKGILVREASAPTKSRMEIVERLRDLGHATPISEADVVVVGGRGMGQAKNFELLERLAKLLGGQVGATRQAVDMGWAPYSAQIGLSGHTVSPRLYLAFGVSGAIQHIAGMSSAGRVIAVNRDSEAPIFGVADLGVVGDVGEVLPALIEELEKGGAGR